jgi:hypothetical protein
LGCLQKDNLKINLNISLVDYELKWVNEERKSRKKFHFGIPLIHIVLPHILFTLLLHVDSVLHEFAVVGEQFLLLAFLFLAGIEELFLLC